MTEPSSNRHFVTADRRTVSTVTGRNCLGSGPSPDVTEPQHCAARETRPKQEPRAEAGRTRPRAVPPPPPEHIVRRRTTPGRPQRHCPPVRALTPNGRQGALTRKGPTGAGISPLADATEAYLIQIAPGLGVEFGASISNDHNDDLMEDVAGDTCTCGQRKRIRGPGSFAPKHRRTE